MKTFSIMTTFTEKVYGRIWFEVKAASEEEALDKLREGPFDYPFGTKTDASAGHKVDLDDIDAVEDITDG